MEADLRRIGDPVAVFRLGKLYPLWFYHRARLGDIARDSDGGCGGAAAFHALRAGNDSRRRHILVCAGAGDVSVGDRVRKL